MEEFCDDGDELSGCIKAENSFIKQITISPSGIGYMLSFSTHRYDLLQILEGPRQLIGHGD
jgi:hypothetical protein